ncbi:unnamed protein product [Absidia cylindrospora]
MESLRRLIFKDVEPSSDMFASDDCLTCQDPCEEHQAYPPLDIKTDRNIAATTKPYNRHILITRQSTMITCSSLVSIHSTISGAQDLFILPDNIVVAQCHAGNVDSLWSYLQQLDSNKETPPSPSDGLFIKPNPYSALLLLCSHRRRDKRCGVTAPILAREFDHILRNKDNMDDVEIVMVSHIGGHKIAGNVILYTHQGKRGIWYGLVKTCHCKAIVEETLEKGKIIQALYRGAMGNSFTSQEMKSSSLLSW